MGFEPTTYSYLRLQRGNRRIDGETSAALSMLRYEPKFSQKTFATEWIYALWLPNTFQKFRDAFLYISQFGGDAIVVL